jgi:putative ABC transport system substrate-binding protein
VRRREFIGIIAGAAVWPAFALAQTNQVRIGFIASGLPTPAMLSAFRDGLRERGYVEGHNLFIDVRWSQGSFEQNPGVADELVRAKVNIIVTWGTPVTVAARRATSTVPIVMASVLDPVATGLVVSLARPGGNITGVSALQLELSGKQVELLVEIIPGMRSVAKVLELTIPQSILFRADEVIE